MNPILAAVNKRLSVKAADEPEIPQETGVVYVIALQDHSAGEHGPSKVGTTCAAYTKVLQKNGARYCTAHAAFSGESTIVLVSRTMSGLLKGIQVIYHLDDGTTTQQIANLYKANIKKLLVAS